MRKTLLYIIVILLAICTYLSISYAYYSITPENADNIVTNVVIDSCIELSAESVITMSGEYAVPVYDAIALANDDYRTSFAVVNHCANDVNVKVALAPTSDSTIQIAKLKSAVYEQSAAIPTSGSSFSSNSFALNSIIIDDVYNQTGDTVSTGYTISSPTIPANTTKYYYAHVWIDRDEGGTKNSTFNKVGRFHLIVAESDKITA